MQLIDKVALLHIKDGKILSTRSYGKILFYLPGGKREGDETDEETLVRECKEELTVDIKVDTMKYYGTFQTQAEKNGEDVMVKITCYFAEFDGELSPDTEIEELVWLEYNDVEKISPIDKFVFNDLYQKKMID